MKKNTDVTQGARPKVLAIIALPLIVLCLFVVMSVKRTPKTTEQVAVQASTPVSMQKSESEQQVGITLESHAIVQFDTTK